MMISLERSDISAYVGEDNNKAKREQMTDVSERESWRSRGRRAGRRAGCSVRGEGRKWYTPQISF